MKKRLTLHLLGAILLGMTGQVSASSLALKDEAAARKLYLTKCTKCHKLYDPAKYSDANWDKWKGKMSRKARLTPEQEKQLFSYLEEQFRHPKPPAQAGAASPPQK